MPNPADLNPVEAELLGYTQPTPEEIEEREKQETRKLLRVEYLRNQMRNDLFREWMMEVLNGFNTFGRTFAASPTGFPDTAATEFHLGMKAAGWYLWEVFDGIDPQLASIMRRESKP